MANERQPDYLGEVWRNQKAECTQMTLEQVRGIARKYQRKILVRNAIEYAAIAAVAVFFACSMWKYPAFMRVGAGLCIAGGLYVAYQLHRRASVRPMPADMALTNCLEFHRRELERQRDFLRSIWRWYLGPLLPGLAILMMSAGMANPGHLRNVWLIVGGYSVVIAAAFAMVARWNRRIADKIQGRIDELNAAARQ